MKRNNFATDLPGLDALETPSFLQWDLDGARAQQTFLDMDTGVDLFNSHQDGELLHEINNSACSQWLWDMEKARPEGSAPTNVSSSSHNTSSSYATSSANSQPATQSSGLSLGFPSSIQDRRNIKSLTLHLQSIGRLPTHSVTETSVRTSLCDKEKVVERSPETLKLTESDLKRTEPSGTSNDSKAQDSTITRIGEDGKWRPSGKTRFQCPHEPCEKTFSTGGHARRHSRLHSDARLYSCPHTGCASTFSRRDNCTQHQRARHRGQVTDPTPMARHVTAKDRKVLRVV